MDVALVLLGVFQDDFDDGALLPVIEFPLHLYVLPFAEGDVFALDLPLQDREGSSLHRLRLRRSTRVAHYQSKSGSLVLRLDECGVNEVPWDVEPEF